LETTVLLAATNNWTNVITSPTLVGDKLMVTNEIGVNPRYYRLRGPPPAAPALTNVSAPGSLGVSSNGVLAFDFNDPDADIATLTIVRSNALGWRTSNIPAQAISLQGAGGQSNLPLDPRDLAFGPNLLILHLIDSGGRVSGETPVEISINGDDAGGTAPVLSNVSLSPASARRPTGSWDELRVSVGFNFTDADGDLARVRVLLHDGNGGVRGTEYSAAALGLNGTSGSFNAPMLTFRATDLGGSYPVQITLFDRNGNESATSTLFFTLEAYSGSPPLAITSISQSEGSAGTRVDLYLTGFSSFYTNPASYRVFLGSVPAPVVSAGTFYAAVLVPSNALSGYFRIEASNRVAYAEEFFTVPGILRLSPQTADAPTVAAGAQLQFTAQLVAKGPTALTWSVNGVPGGNATIGTISSNGLFVAPAAIPAGSNVTVSVWQASNPAVSNQTVLTITAPPAAPARATILAAIGGSVKSADGLAGVTIPTGAMAANGEITVRSLRGTNTPPNPPTLQTLGAAEFGPAGLIFTQAVTISLPLIRHLDPGTALNLMLFNPTNSTFTDLGPVATVGPNGDFATASVTHFSVYVVVVPLPAIFPDPPGITNITPSAALEGAKIPVLLSGTNLTSDLVPEILLSGVPTDDILPGTLYTATNQAGLLLDIQTITNLAEGVARNYTLRLRRGTTATYTDVDFTVNGLDELILLPGQHVVSNNPTPRTFSEIFIHSNASLSIATGGFDVQATGPVRVDGDFLAEGINGGNGGPVNGGPGAGGPTPGGTVAAAAATTVATTRRIMIALRPTRSARRATSFSSQTRSTTATAVPRVAARTLALWIRCWTRSTVLLAICEVASTPSWG